MLACVSGQDRDADGRAGAGPKLQDSLCTLPSIVERFATICRASLTGATELTLIPVKRGAFGRGLLSRQHGMLHARLIGLNSGG
jgi:hypothetical protein